MPDAVLGWGRERGGEKEKETETDTDENRPRIDGKTEMVPKSKVETFVFYAFIHFTMLIELLLRLRGQFRDRGRGRVVGAGERERE